MEKLESIIQIEILNYLSRVPNSIVIRNNNAPLYDRKRECYRKPSRLYCPNGISDITFYYSGKAYAIEVKTEKEYKFVVKHYDRLLNGFAKTKKDVHIQNQILFIESVKRTGNAGFFTCSLDDCINKMGKDFKKN